MKFNIKQRKVWFSSDFHFLHKNIIKSISEWADGAQRDFNHVDEMNDEIINQMNKNIGENDVLFMLGDFAFGDKTKIPELRKRLNVKEIHLIFGNHDHNLRKHYTDVFTSCADYREITLVEQQPEGKALKTRIVLCHYPIFIWNGHAQGFIHLYGHTHGSIKDETFLKRRVLDVGIDNAFEMFGEYKPFSAEFIIEEMNKREVIFLDHHSEDTNVY